MTDHIDRTTFGDLAGREVTWADPAAPHQITVAAESHPPIGIAPGSALIGCTCGAERIRQAMEAPIAEMWLAYHQLDHLPRAGEVVHECPADREGVMPCCGRTPFEVDPMSRMSTDPLLVTCGRNA